MRLLPRSEWALQRGTVNRDVVSLCCLVNRFGYRTSIRFALSELPNDLVSVEDLKRLGIDHIDVPTVV